MGVALLLGGLPTVARADDDKLGPDRWTPSLMFEMGFTIQEMKGTADSEALGGGDDPGGFVDSETNSVSPQLTLGLELMSPAIDIPGRPSLFISGEVGHVSSQSRRLAGERDPGELREPDIVSGLFNEEAVLGQGSETRGDFENRFYGATAGVSFPFEIGDWRFAAKPSVRYYHREFQASGLVSRAYRPLRAGPTSFLSLPGEDSTDVHALGPGFELEMDGAKFFDLDTVFFVSIAAYNVLNDTDLAFSTTGSDSLNNSGGPFIARYTTEIDDWFYRAGAGVRLRWSGLPEGWLPR